MNKVIILLALLTTPFLVVNTQEIKHIDSKVFSELIKSGDGIVLDVRTPGEYSRGHIESSTMISTNDPKFVEKVNLLQKNKTIYVYCLTGSRSRAVANYLIKNGFNKVYNLQRGIMEWQRMGYPVSQSNNSIASESKSFNEVEFKKLINSKNVVLVDFHATWCAPCKKMAPIIEKLQNDYKGKAIIEKIDIEANKELQTKLNVQSVPEVILFKNGKEVWRHSGFSNYNDLSGVINKNL